MIYMTDITIQKSTAHTSADAVNAHLGSLKYPIDSWLEDKLLGGDLYRFERDGLCVGYCVIEERTLRFFHVLREYYKDASAMLARIVREFGIEKVMVMTQDSQLCALLVEWDYDKERLACWFADSGCDVDAADIAQSAVFRKAQQSDAERIRGISGDFFDEDSEGYYSLEERIDAGNMFVLEQDDKLLGCGIVRDGRVMKDVLSIGMFTSPEYRQKGVAKTILLNLKNWAYAHGKTPVAGCWYYNTLSRRSLEAAGMIAVSLGYEAVLKKKDNPPKRTGNPPGELVES